MEQSIVHQDRASEQGLPSGARGSFHGPAPLGGRLPSGLPRRAVGSGWEALAMGHLNHPKSWLATLANFDFIDSMGLKWPLAKINFFR